MRSNAVLCACCTGVVLVSWLAGAVAAVPPKLRPGGVTSSADVGQMDLLVLDRGQTKVRDYMLAEIHKQYEARRRHVAAAMSSPETLRLYQARLRERYGQLIGPPPAKTPLNPVVTGVIRCDGYSIEKVAFESRPGFHVTANLYLPTGGTAPYPGVVVPCGHSPAGKAYDAYQRVAILLAKNGLLALVYDPLGQGERRHLNVGTAHAGSRHKLLNVNSIPVGRHFVHYSVWDGVRAIDYLHTRVEFDASKPVGVTGNSGGGGQTMFLMALDDRVGPAAPSCHITALERNFELGGAGDGCQSPPLTGLLGFEHPDFFTLRAPQPSIILAAERDYKDITFTRKTFREARQAYELLGRGERMEMFAYDDGHAFSKPRREEAVGWMRRWLLDDASPVQERALDPQPQNELNVTSTGNVLTSFDGARSLIEINLDRAKQLASARDEFWQSGTADERLAAIRDLIGARKELAAPQLQSKGAIHRDGYRIEKLILQREAEPPIPGLLLLPEQPAGRTAALYVDGRGKTTDAQPGGPVEELVARGRIVLSVDIRGCGETTDEGGRAPYGKGDHRLAMWALHLGRPLLGQRVEDVLAARMVLAVRDDVDADHIELIGVGRAGPVVLHAAALASPRSKVTLRDSIESWIDGVVARPNQPDAIGHVVPGSLERYDLPDLLRLLP